MGGKVSRKKKTYDVSDPKATKEDVEAVTAKEKDGKAEADNLVKDDAASSAEAVTEAAKAPDETNSGPPEELSTVGPEGAVQSQAVNAVAEVAKDESAVVEDEPPAAVEEAAPVSGELAAVAKEATVVAEEPVELKEESDPVAAEPVTAAVEEDVVITEESVPKAVEPEVLVSSTVLEENVTTTESAPEKPVLVTEEKEHVVEESPVPAVEDKLGAGEVEPELPAAPEEAAAVSPAAVPICIEPEKIDPEPISETAVAPELTVEETAVSISTVEQVLEQAPEPETIPEPVLEQAPEPETIPEPVLEQAPEPETIPEPVFEQAPEPEDIPEPVLEQTPEPEDIPEPVLEQEPAPVPEPVESSELEQKPEQVQEPEQESAESSMPEQTPELISEPQKEPESDLVQEPEPESVESSEPDLKPEPLPEQEKVADADVMQEPESDSLHSSEPELQQVQSPEPEKVPEKQTEEVAPEPIVAGVDSGEHDETVEATASEALETAAEPKAAPLAPEIVISESVSASSLNDEAQHVPEASVEDVPRAETEVKSKMENGDLGSAFAQPDVADVDAPPAVNGDCTVSPVTETQECLNGKEEPAEKPVKQQSDFELKKDVNLSGDAQEVPDEVSDMLESPGTEVTLSV